MTCFFKRIIPAMALGASILVLAARAARAGRIKNPPPVVDPNPPAAVIAVSPETLAARAGWGRPLPDAVVDPSANARPFQLKVDATPRTAPSAGSAKSAASSGTNSHGLTVQPMWLLPAGAALLFAALLARRLTTRRS